MKGKHKIMGVMRYIYEIIKNVIFMVLGMKRETEEENRKRGVG